MDDTLQAWAHQAELEHQQQLEEQRADELDAERRVRRILDDSRIRPLFAVEVQYLIAHMEVKP